MGFQVDKRGIQEHRASLYLQLNRVKEAEEAYRQLLDVNPDNYRYKPSIALHPYSQSST